MSTKTEISWTDYSSNPVKYRDNETGKTVWACVKKSAGCANCYAEALALRWGKGRQFSRPNLAQVTPFLDEKELKRLLSEKAIPSGAKVFVGDMTDLFGSWVPDEFLVSLWRVFAQRHDVTFQVLTKRPERMVALLGSKEFRYAVDEGLTDDWVFPLPNVWLGTSVEQLSGCGYRITELQKAPAAVRFISAEPLIGPLDLSRYLGVCRRCDGSGIMAIVHLRTNYGRCDVCNGSGTVSLEWVIVGGESGPKHRPMDPDWLASLVGQCREAGVPVWVKQDSGQHPGRQGRIPDDLYAQQFPSVAVPS